jgi:uncharacterized LabA/DUF88 family protein
MNRQQITQFLDTLAKTKERNMVIIDFANVDRWEDSLGWKIGIKQLGQLISYISYGKKFLRRFYYGEDYGPKNSSRELTPWSNMVTTSARFSGFELISKRVKYIPDEKYETGFIKKCNLDIEMAIDLIREKDNYDTAIIFSGDGDLACACKYIYEMFKKKVYVFGARDHIGKELIDAQKDRIIKDILFVEDFEYRLNLKRSF